MEETIVEEQKVFTIKDKEFVIPKEITHRQYFRVAAMFKSAGIDSTSFMSRPKLDVETNELELGFKTGNTLQRLLDGGKIPEFFATILVPKGESIWVADFLDKHLDLMDDIGDKTALEVLRDFLAGRVDLIVGLWNYFTDFMSKNEKLINNLNLLSKNEEEKTSQADVK